MSIEIKSDILAKELNQGIVPLGVPKAYQYDAALVEAARAAVNQGLDDVAEAGDTAVNSVKAQESTSTININTLGDKILAQMKHGYGYPFTAANAAAMTDTAKIYVYTGAETGYANGNWYYWNGTAWTSGGVYNATALETDKTLTISGAAADAYVTGNYAKKAVGKYATDYFDKNNLIDGFVSGGAVYANQDWKHTDYIPCSIGDGVYCAKTNGRNLCCCSVYDANKNWLYDLTHDAAGGVSGASGYYFGYIKTSLNGLPKYVIYNVAPTTWLSYDNQFFMLESKSIARDNFPGAMYSGLVLINNNLVNDFDIDNLPNGGLFAIQADLYANQPKFNAVAAGTTGDGLSIIQTGYYNGTTTYNGSLQLAFSNHLGDLATRAYADGHWSLWGYHKKYFYANPSNFLEVIETACGSNDATVIFEPGTYNLFDSTHDEAYWKNRRYATRYMGIMLKNNVHLIGRGRVVFNAKYTGSDEDILENFSVFNVVNSCFVHNIEVEAQNICYVVHDDSMIVDGYGYDLGAYCIWSECRFTHLGSTHTFTYGAPVCFGCGITPYGNTVIIKNCILTSSQDNRTISWHTSTNGYANIIITDNVISGNVRFWNMDNSGKIVAIVSNNKLSAVDGTSDTWLDLHAFNNITNS